MQGFTGKNCSSPCPYPTYGNECQNLCNCSKDMCNVFTGCQISTTGMFDLFYKKKIINNAQNTFYKQVDYSNALYWFKLK